MLARAARARLAAIAFLLAVGVPSKWYAGPGAAFVVGEAWDACGSAIVLLTARLLLPALRPVTTGLVVAGLLVGDELLQLVHAPWLETLRATAVGRVVLGNGWSLLDLAVITSAVAVTAVLDARFLTERSA